MKQNIFYATMIAIGIVLLFFIVCCTWIGYDVKSQCQDAKRRYKGDCVEALTKLVDDKSRDFRTRNSAIWALGQLGDRRALSHLNKYYTGIIPSKEPLDKSISQYELKKAIKLTSGGINITSFVWKGYD